MSPRGEAEEECPRCSLAGTEYSPRPGELGVFLRGGEAWLGASRGRQIPRLWIPDFPPGVLRGSRPRTDWSYLLGQGYLLRAPECPWGWVLASLGTGAALTYPRW